MSRAPTFDEFLARLRAEPSPAPAPRYGRYRSYRGVFEAVEVLRADARVEVEMFGRSAGGEPLWATRLGRTDGGARGRLLILAGLHAQEVIGVEAALRTCERALSRMATGDPLLDGLEITCVPCANPDGYRRVVAEASRAGSARTGFHRKNARGVDLNRNFAAGFDARAPLARALPFVFSPGAAPLSEPETAALDALFSRRFDRALSLHSFGGFVFWPWASRALPTVDDAEFARLAERMRGRMRRPYRAQQLGRYARWLRAGGSEIDHLYARFGTRAFLVEIAVTHGRALRPASFFDAFAWYNPTDVEDTSEDVAAGALALAEGPWPLAAGERALPARTEGAPLPPRRD